MAHDSFSLDDFDGTVRLFPLPNLVMFPHVVQQLRIFEPRYVEMLEDSIKTDRLIATALLLPGWEDGYDKRPPIDPVVCLGRVMTHSPTGDGQYNILLGGISRAEIVTELPTKRSYREAEVTILRDVPPEPQDAASGELHSELVHCFRKLIPNDAPPQKQLDEILQQEEHLGTLTDLISYSLPLDLALQQSLLAEVNVIQRTRLLLDQLRRHAAGDSNSQPFPPHFSEN